MRNIASVLLFLLLTISKRPLFRMGEMAKVTRALDVNARKVLMTARCRSSGVPAPPALKLGQYAHRNIVPAR